MRFYFFAFRTLTSLIWETGKRLFIFPAPS